MSELEKNYKEVAKLINANIKGAAKLMKEANALAKKAGLSGLTTDSQGENYDEDGNSLSEEDEENLEEFSDLINISPLFNELDKAGWRTSSIGC
jgi:hypothetical protein